MSRIPNSLLLPLFFCFVFESKADHSNSNIKLAATEWCPYICDDQDSPGFIVEYMTSMLSVQDITLKVDVLPWSRAINDARKGEYDGLLTATEQEAPDFIFIQEPTGFYQICFYGAESSDFSYKNRQSLQGYRVGVIADYGYGEPLDSILVSPMKNESFYEISGKSPLPQLVRMAELGRIDAFVDDRSVVEFYLKSQVRGGSLRQLDCFEEIPFYTAVSPASKHKHLWLQALQRSLTSPDSDNVYESFKLRYVR